MVINNLYHAQYGSPETDITPVQVTNVSASDDHQRVSLELDRLVPGRVYELKPRGIKSETGDPLVTTIAAYTLNRLF